MSSVAPGGGARRDASTLRRWWLVDGGFVVALGALGLLGFGPVYGSVAYLEVGAVGLLLGVAATELARRWGQPVLAEVFVAVVVFLLLGGALAAPGSALAGVIPTPGTLSALGHAGVDGWKELLTTAPPVGDSSDLLAIPYLLGLICGVAGQSLAQRTRSVLLPLGAPVGVLVLGILFGADHPASLVLQGSVFAGLALAWMVLRHERRRAVSWERVGGLRRLGTAIALVALAAAAATYVGPELPGASAHQRVVLSRYVVPPFAASQQPSPLAAFRRYVTGGADNHALLFTVTGLGAGSLVRIATMDSYNGIVWGFAAASGGRGAAASADAFHRFGASIPSSSAGPTVEVGVRLGALGGVWLPDVGQTTRISFSGSDAAELAAGFRYDPVTDTAAEPGGLSPGVSYHLVAVDPPTPSAAELAAATAAGVSVEVSGVPSVVGTDAEQWSAGASGTWGKLMAIADHFLAVGYYSNGTGPGGGPVLSAPGHGAGRLATFLQGGGLVGTDIVGDDEQYAATFALMANAIGVPARVVLGAVVGPGGVVRGSDVHAWIEVDLAGLGWVTIPTDRFMPTRPAHEVPPSSRPQTARVVKAAPPVVAASHPPPAGQLSGSAADSSLRAPRHRRPPFRLPAWVRTVAWALFPPLGLLGAVAGSIRALKRRRRRRRRRAPAGASQIAGAWAELLDRARDLGRQLPARATRREQASSLGRSEAKLLATRADAAVFAPGEPTGTQVAEFWRAADELADALLAEAGSLRRWRAALSVRSLRSAPDVAGGGR